MPINKPLDTLLEASVLILTPTEKFRLWLKKAGLNNRIFPTFIDHNVADTDLEKHALAFLIPRIESHHEAQVFFQEQEQTLLNFMFAAWPFEPSTWPNNNGDLVLTDICDLSYYFYLINMQNSKMSKDNLDVSISILKPKEAFKIWLDNLNTDIGDYSLDAYRHCGLAMLMPHFTNDEEKNDFISLHVSILFKRALSLYCNDTKHWPTDLNLEQFTEWFDCVNFYPPIDLISIINLKKVA